MSGPTSSLSTIDEIRERALGFVSSPVSLGDLRLAFAESRASSVDVHVEGRNFYPPILEDIHAATSSVHINQFGFRPGVVGDAFADALIAKAATGVPVRLVVDRQGSDPERSSLALYDRLTDAGIQVCVVRATKPRAQFGPLGGDGATSLESGRARPHRSPQGRRRRRSNRLGRRSRRRGPFPGRPLPRPVPPRHRPGGRTAAARVRRQLPVARRRDSLGRSRAAVPGARCRTGCRSGRRASQRAGPVPADHRRDRAHPRGREGDARRRQPVRDRPADDPAHRGSRPPWRPRPPLRSGEPEQLGVRGRSAVPPRELARRRCPHPRVPDDAAREGVRARRRGAARGHVQPRGLEPEALLRDRPPGLVEGPRPQFDERFSADAETVSSPGQPLEGAKERAKATAFALLSPLL